MNSGLLAGGGRGLLDWVGPLVFGLLSYLSVVHYGSSELGYNRQVAGYVVVAASAILIVLVFRGRKPIADRRTLVLGFALAASIAVSTWMAPSFYWAVNRLHLYFAVVLLGLTWYLLSPGRLDRVVEKYLLVIPAVHAWFVIEALFWALASASEADWDIAFPNYANIRHFAYHGFIAAAAASSLFLVSSRLQSAAWILTTLALFGIVLLGARGALAAWVVYVAFVLVCHRRRVSFLVFCILAFVFASAVVYYLAAVDAIRLTTLFHRIGGGAEKALFVADRVAVWGEAVNGIARHPWFGSGPEAFRMSGCCVGSFAQPHNFVLQFLLEFGVIGFALLITLSSSVLARFDAVATLRRGLGRNLDLTVLVAILTGFIAYAMVDGLFYHAIPLMHFALLFALLLGAMRTAAGSTGEPR